MLLPTPPEKLVDAHGRPCFLWDCDMTVAEFQRRLREEGEEGRACLIGKLMRQAQPDDVFTFVSVAEIVAAWPQLRRYLGESLPFRRWLLNHRGRDAEAA